MIASINELFISFSGGQFRPVCTGQFQSVSGGHYKSVGGGQFHRFLHQVNLNDSLLKIIDEEIAIHFLLMNDSSFADTANLMIQQLLSQYQSLSALNKNLLLNLKNESISLASSALVRNNTIVPTNFNEFIEKKVNDIYLRTFGQGIDTLTNVDRTDLESIIHICPLAGGPAIYRARALYNLLNDTIFYNDRLVCANAGYFRESQEQLMPELKSTVKQSPKIDLFPNPANDQLMLLFGGDIEAGKIEIYNLTGAIVAKYNINKNTVNKVLDINEISEGYYMIHFNLGNYNTVKSFIKVK
jgi:hypothetical protein